MVSLIEGRVVKTKVIIFLLNGGKVVSEFNTNNQSVLPRTGEAIYVDDMVRMQVKDVRHVFKKDSAQSYIEIMVGYF